MVGGGQMKGSRVHKSLRRGNKYCQGKIFSFDPSIFYPTGNIPESCLAENGAL